MINIFIRKFRGETSVPYNLRYRTELSKARMASELIKGRTYISSAFVPNSHPIVRLLEHIHTDEIRDIVEYQRLGRLRAMNMRVSLGFVHPNNLIRSTAGYYIPGGHVREYVMLLDKQGGHEGERWLGLRPLRMASHPFVTNKFPDFNKPFAKPLYVDKEEEASCFMSLDVGMLLRQYRGWLREQDRLGEPRGAQQYVAQLLIPGLTKDFINLGLLNIAYQRWLGRSGMDKIPVPVYQLPPNRLDVFMNKRNLRSIPPRTVNALIDYLPALGEGGLMGTLNLYDVPQYGRYRMWTWLACSRNIRMIVSLSGSVIRSRERALWADFAVAYKRLLLTKLLPDKYKIVLDEALHVMLK